MPDTNRGAMVRPCLHERGRGAVNVSQRINIAIASLAESPHISWDGRSPEQTPGRSGLPNSAHVMSESR